MHCKPLQLNSFIALCTCLECLFLPGCVCVCVPQEYGEGKTTEAVLVKDLDKFDMVFQAFEYEKCKL